MPSIYSASDIRAALEHYAESGDDLAAPDGVRWSVEYREPENDRERHEEGINGLLFSLDRLTGTQWATVYMVRTGVCTPSDAEYSLVSMFCERFENEQQNEAEAAFERSLSGDEGGGSDGSYRRDMQNAGRGHLLP